MEGRRSIQGAGSMAERQHVSPTDLDSIKLTGKVETITTEESRPVHSANQVPQYQQSLESTYEEVVLHMTEALAALPPAVTRDPRPLSQPALPTRPDPAATSRLPPVPPIAAEAQTPSATTRTAKKKKTQLDTITCHLILSGTVFVAISLLYIVLAFSLPAFPIYLHLFFIGLLVTQCCYVLHSMIRKRRALRKKKKVKSVVDGPPLGSIVQGAQNWNGLPNDPEEEEQEDYDLENIGLKEALKPIPPAYGMYRGSIRIADTDIRWVRRNEVTEPIPGEREGGEGQRIRPPSYASDGGLIV